MAVGAPSVSYSEQADASPVASGLLISSDDELLNIVSASIELDTPDAKDTLEFGTASFGGTSSAPYNSNNKMMTITGDGNFKAYQVWLRDIRFKNMDDRPTTGTRTVTFKAGGLHSSTSQLNLSRFCHLYTDAIQCIPQTVCKLLQTVGSVRSKWRRGLVNAHLVKRLGARSTSVKNKC